MGRAVERVAIALALAWVSGVAVEAQAAAWQGERSAARAEWARPDLSERLAAAKKKKAKGKKKVKPVPDSTDTTPAPTPTPTPEPAGGKNGTTTPAGGAAGAKPGTTSGAVLDLSDIKTDGSDAAAKQQLLKAPEQPKADDKKAKKGGGAGFDFGGGVSIDLGGGDAIDFGGDLGSFDVQINISSAERERVEKAMGMMTDEDYAKAALEFSYFLKDPKFAEFKQESEYQLAKALYKLGFLDGALKRFKAILEQGPSHVRYKKSVEWLFFISRKVADETPVLAELARFRNVTFPKAYRNEYRYLLSKYLFVQAQRFEADRLQLEQVARGKKSTDGIDFGALAEASKSDGFDFSKATSSGLDFSAVGGGESGGMDFGAVGSGGGMDFGGGGASSGGGMDFGAPAGGGASKPAGGGGGGFDFGGGGADSKGGFDFGAQGGGAQPQGGGSQMVREAAPQTAKEAAEQGLNLIGQVDKESKFFPRARYLEGLLAFFDGQDTKAVAAFQDVVRVLNPRAGARLDPKLREMAFLSLARIHYGHKQFDKSVYYYDQIDRDSENWLTALFEASWAYYRRGDFEKALGNLLTLHSPFFEREYFPESQMVKAIIYFEACRYAETRDIVDRFIDRFTAVMKAIDKIAQSQDAPELLYERIAQLQKEAALNQDDVTSRVVSLALNDSDIRTARKVVLQVNEQLELWRKSSESFRQSRLGEDLNTELKDALAARTREAGEITRRKFETELYALKGLLAQALRIKIEVARSERDSIEKKMRNEATGDELVPATARTVVDDEHVYWPYEGEYWRDELGTYELDFTQCRPLTAGGS